jgi:hypothetical protein
VLEITAGLSRTLRVGAEPVLLATAAGTTKVATWTVFAAGQAKLVAS